MNFLMDTHSLIWVLEDNKNLSPVARATILDLNNQIFVSTINLWEISLRSSIGKLVLEGFDITTLPTLIKKMDFDILTLSAEDASSYHLLGEKFHRDPFDRMLIWQAIRNNFALITKDPIIKLYESEGLRTLW